MICVMHALISCLFRTLLLNLQGVINDAIEAACIDHESFIATLGVKSEDRVLTV